MSVRDASFDDREAVGHLFAGAGWHRPSRAEWERNWLGNPALDTDRPAPSRGWVMEEEGQVVGFLGNLPQLYHYDGADLLAAVAVSFVVAPASRAMALQLLTRFGRQSNVDLLLGTTATPQAARLLQFLEFAALSTADASRSLYWIVGPAGFLAAALRKKALGSRRSATLGAVLGPGLAVADRLTGHRPPAPRATRLRLEVAPPEAIGAEFDGLWTRKRAEGKRVMAVRSRAVLAHRFAHMAGRAQVVCAWNGTRLAGYTILVRADSDAIGLKRLLLADLMVEQDDPDIAAQLLAASCDEARRAGGHVLEAHGYAGASLALLEAGRPRVRAREGWPFLYKATDAGLHAALAPAAWYATLFDGDRC